MNCQDISSILDDQDIARLSDVERRSVDAHLPACVDCAREWAVHQRLLAVTIPPLPAALTAQCRLLIASKNRIGADTQGRRRAGSRLILLGSLAAIAAAAAMLYAVLRNSDEVPATSDVAVLPSPVESATATLEEPAAAEPVAPKPLPAEPRKKSEPLLASPHFTVRILPLQDRTTDESSRAAVTAFYAALTDGLREVPGLTLLESAEASDRIRPGEFQLTVKGAGPVQGKWAMDMLLVTDIPVAGDPKGGYARVPYRLAYGGVPAPLCAESRIDMPATNCSNPQGGAAGMVDLMRQVAFPLDPNARHLLQARLLDRTVDASQRWQAFENLRSERAVVRAGAQAPTISRTAPAVDAETLRGVLDLAASTDNPFIRNQIWLALRGVREPALMQRLIDSSRLESDDNVRMGAVTTLAADYSQDENGRAALESIAINDSREIVRMIAQRALTGDAIWNEYADSRLQNASLTDGQRVEALAYMAASGEGRQQLRGLLNATNIDILAQLMPRALAALPNSSPLRPTDSLLYLADVLSNTNQPATIEMLIHMAREVGDPQVRRMAVTGLNRHRDDARAQAVLEDIAANDSDPMMRDQAKIAQPQLVTPPPGT